METQQTQTQTRTYYAVYYPYGVRALNTWGNDDPAAGGTRADQLRTYRTRAERDAAVAADPDHLEAVLSRDPALRRYLRRNRQA